MKSRVLVVHGGSYYSPFSQFGSLYENSRILDYAPEEVKLLVFTGGSDVDPSFYGEKKCDGTWSSPHRDIEEQAIFQKAVELGIPMFGICRGLQFLCAMAGGKLFQHVNHHAGRNHKMLTNENEVITINSLHHQMIMPAGTNHILLGWAAPKISDVYVVADEQGNDRFVETEYETEAAAFLDVNACGVQYHPEMMSGRGATYATELAARLIDGEFKNTTSPEVKK